MYVRMYMHACSVMSNSLQPLGLQPARLLCPWDFPRQEYWTGVPFPFPGYLPNPGIELTSPTSSALAGVFFATRPPGNPIYILFRKDIVKEFNTIKEIS